MSEAPEIRPAKQKAGDAFNINEGGCAIPSSWDTWRPSPPGRGSRAGAGSGTHRARAGGRAGAGSGAGAHRAGAGAGAHRGGGKNDVYGIEQGIWVEVVILFFRTIDVLFSSLPSKMDQQKDTTIPGDG